MHPPRTIALLVALSLALVVPAGATSATPDAAATAARALGLAATLQGAAFVPPSPGDAVVPASAYPEALAVLLPAVAEAERVTAAALAALAPGELAFARATAEAALAGRARPRDVALARGIIARIDMGALASSAAMVVDASARAMPLVRGPAPATATCTPGNLVCIGTEGDDVWTEDVQVLIDPGGDDLYLNNAGGVLNRQGFDAMGGCAFGGGTTGRARPDLGCTAAPSAVCSYDVANEAAGRDDLPVVSLPGHDDPDGPDGGRGTDGSCGSDARGERLIENTAAIDEDADSRLVSVLLDLDGSDVYTAPWSHDDPLFGLIDDCFPGEEHIRNTNRDLFQGSALGGIGIAWDAGTGDDVWRGRLNAQGSGHVGGVGVLITSGSGDATFWADRLAQGNGIAGGIGVLVNAKEGAHTYLLEPPVVYRNEFGPSGRGCTQEGRAGQGEGGFGGVGILWTAGGDAVYRSVTHVVGEAYPYAPLRDGDGRPVLIAGTDAQGSGESFPVADTPGGVVAGFGLVVDDTDGDASVCPGAGMIAGATASTGTDLSSIGVPAPCGTFNIAPAIDVANDLGTALQRLLAGAVGMRVVV